jgi:Suppressor of fused protein (SUFU)
MASDETNYPIAAPGWAALDQACAIVHPGALPHQFTSATPYDLDSRNPLPAVCVWETLSGQWHYVTYGLSELFEKASPRADVSGFGFELGLRLPREPGALRPPAWPLTLLQGIGHYVMSGHGELDSGHIVALDAPITGAAGPGAPVTALEGVVCVPDPQFGKVDTVHGSVLFLLLVGLTADELGAMNDWDLARKVGLVHELAPDGVTDVGRRSWRSDPRRATTFRRYELKVLL